VSTQTPEEAEMISIDSEKCTNCGICYDVCPSKVIGIRSAEGHDEVFVRYPEFCTVNPCGQCVGFCKPGAITLTELPYDDFQELSEIDVTPDSMKNLLLSRRSVRKYKDEPVPESLIEDLIEVATHAGTGSNSQSVNFVVVKDRELIEKLEQSVLNILAKKLKPLEIPALVPVIRMVLGSETTDTALSYYEKFKRRREDDELKGTIFWNAPLLMLAHDVGKNAMGPLNCAIAMRNVEIMALTMGLGTCWSGFLVLAAHEKPKVINEFLGLEDSRRIWGALMIGYPKYKSRVKIPRLKREVTYL
jgi:nitroreductase/NAD-dependent dihydropyrimidine dehydrogenase PreA subunit